MLRFNSDKSVKFHSNHSVLVYTLISTFFFPYSLSAQQFPEAYYRAQAALSQNDYTSAVHWADSCLKLKPVRYQYLLLKGKALLHSNHLNDAITCFNLAERQRYGAASFWLAKTYCRKGDTLACIVWAKNNLQSAYKEPESWFMLDDDFEKLKNHPEWKNLWDKDWFTPAERDIQYARYLIDAGHYDDAIELLNKRIKRAASKATFYELRGQAHLNAGNYQLALDDFVMAHRKYKRNHQYLALQAQCLSHLNQYSKALIRIEQAISSSGGDPEYLLTKAQILSNLKLWDKAYETTKRYREFYPNNLTATKLLIDCAYEAGYYTEALLAIAKLIRISPNNPELIFKRGTIYLKTKNLQESIADFEFNIKQNFRVPDAYLGKAKALLALGEKNEACKSFSISANLGNLEAQSLQYNLCRNNR